jgi:hypothetical protein
MEQIHGGLKDIFNTILNNQDAANRSLPPIIILHGNGHVIAPGGTVHVIQQPRSDTARISQEDIIS